jgi:ATP synthase protein I
VVAPGVREGAIAAGLVGVAATATAAAASGGPGIRGALIGAGLVLGTFGFGAMTVNAVASVMPSASLLVALLTYTLQIALLGLVFWGLTSSGATEDAIDPTWLGGTAVSATVAWLIGQITGAMRARQPIYDLDASGPGSGGKTGGGE